MKIVIDIPKNLYKWIKDSDSITLGDKWMNTLTSAIRKSAIYEEPSKNEALQKAITTLEAEPCEDCISRSEALKVIEEQKQGFMVLKDMLLTKLILLL